jgi:hypothetical protein
MFPAFASLATAAGSGAMGAACEIPGIVAKAITAIAAANKNRLMLFSLDEPNVAKQTIRKHDGGSATREIFAR